MKRIICSIAVATVFLLIGMTVSAEEQTTWGTLKTLTDQGPVVAAKAANKDASDIFDFGDLSLIKEDGSTLTRSTNGVNIKFHTVGLTAGDAVTLWWVVFNNPGACEAGCGEDDLFREGVDASALHAAGHVVGASGNGNFNGHLHVEDDSEALFGPGLLDPQAAEIHLVLRTHGPAIPGLIPAQIHTFGGGCSEATGGPLDEDDPDNLEDNECADIQFSVHLAPSP